MTEASTRIDVGKRVQVHLTGVLREFEVTPDSGAYSGAHREYRFFLTNLNCLGTRTSRISSRGRHVIRVDTVDLAVCGHRVRLRQRQSYDDVVRNLKTTKGVRVTCELRIRLHGGEPYEVAEELATDMCTILSLASGNHVTWNIVRVYDGQRRWVMSRHRRGITRPFVAQHLIHPDNGKGLQALVENGVSRLRYWNEELGSKTDLSPVRNAIHFYLDARHEGTYLQSRTLVAIIAIDLLVSKLVSKQDRQFILAPQMFEKKVRPEVKRALSSLLKELGIDSKDAHDMEVKLAELNRRPLRKQVESLSLDFPDRPKW